MKLWFVLVLLAIVAEIFSSNSFKPRKVKCTSSNKSIRSNFKCFCKSYSREVSVINFDFYFTRPIYNAMVCYFFLNLKESMTLSLFTSWSIQVHVDMKHRSITPYFNSVINTTVNFCGFLNKTDNNLVSKFLFDVILRTFPKKLFRPCPLATEFKASNVTLDLTPEIADFLKGTYKTTFRMFDSLDDNILTGTLEMELGNVKM